MTLHRYLTAALSRGVLPSPFRSLAAAARLFPGERPGRGVSPGTVYRWGTRGLPLPGGRVVKLRVGRVGRKFVTTPRAIAEFVEAQQPGGAPPARPHDHP